MFKKILIVIGGAFLAVLGFILGRRNSDGRGVRGDNGIVDDLGDGIDRASENNRQLGDRIESSQELTADAKKHNRSALDANRNAQELLKRARLKSRDPVD